MKKGMGHSKGAGFERRICEDLSRFIDPDCNDTLFWRSAMSGGRATRMQKKGKLNKTQMGDITCVDSRGEWLTSSFVLECKFYNSLDIESGLLNGRGRLAKFWRQLCKLAKQAGKQPLLVARQNRTDTLIFTSQRGVKLLDTWGHPVPVFLTTKHLGRVEAHVCWHRLLFGGKS